MLAARDALDPVLRAAASVAITDALLAMPVYAAARTVLAYTGFGSEINTAPLLAATLAAGKTLVLPRVDSASRMLRLYVVRDPDADLVAGVWGIREPDPARCPAADPATIDFALLPCVALTPRGERLGYGGGFCDRLIGSFPRRPPLVAACFAVQLQDSVPLEPTDQRIDGVLTERAAYGIAAAHLK